MTDQLFQELCALEQVEALALGGSRAGPVFDESSDYDVCLYCTGPVPQRAWDNLAAVLPQLERTSRMEGVPL